MKAIIHKQPRQLTLKAETKMDALILRHWREMKPQISCYGIEHIGNRDTFKDSMIIRFRQKASGEAANF